MATLFKPTRPFPLPPDTRIVTHRGKRCVRLTENGKTVHYPLSKDGTKYLKRKEKWYADILQADGTTKRTPLSTNKEAALTMLADKLTEVERERYGYKDPVAKHRKTPLADHLDAWLAVLIARGVSADSVTLKKTRATAILDGCEFVLSADLSADQLERFLESLRTGKKKLSIQTTNDYLQAISQFCRWMVENNRLDRDPFASVKKLNAELDRRHVRRAIDADELPRIVAAALTGPAHRRLSGPDRAMLYRVAASTGYRKKELATLTPECFILDGPAPSVELDGKHTKNRKPARQPIPLKLAADLRVFLAGRQPGRPVWPGKWVKVSSEMIKADATAAGIPVTIDTKDGQQTLDFHSLRVTFATLLDGLDISLKARQELTRHSDPRLTMNRYTRVKLHDLSAAVEKLPDMTPAAPAPASEAAVLKATGTDDGCSSGAVTGAVESGNRVLRLRTDENDAPLKNNPIAAPRDEKNPFVLQGFDNGREAESTAQSGRGGARTRIAELTANRFSRAVRRTGIRLPSSSERGMRNAE